MGRARKPSHELEISMELDGTKLNEIWKSVFDQRGDDHIIVQAAKLQGGEHCVSLSFRYYGFIHQTSDLNLKFQ